jgi:hypothetical protein
MDYPTNEAPTTDPLGLEAGRLDVLTEIVGRAEDLDAQATDDDLDTWWGVVEIDRLASGLTLAAIDTLADPDPADGQGGAWIRKSDPHGDDLTQLTADGRAAVRRILAA